MLHIKAKRGSCQVLSEDGEAEACTVDPRDVNSGVEEAWVKLGRQGEREEMGLGASMELHVGPLLLFLFDAGAVTAKDHLGDCT